MNPTHPTQADQSSQPGRPWLAHPNWPALGILGLGLALRLYGLMRYGLWIDESSGMVIAQSTPAGILQSLTLRLHPPLYFFALHYWMQISDSLFFIRLFPLIWGVATIWLVYRLARDVLGPQPALVSAFLLAISPAHIWYSQEVRMYSLLVLLCTLSFYLAWHWSQGRHILWLAGHVLASTAALYTHYCAAFVLVAGNLAFPLLFILRKDYRKLALWMGAQACVALAFLPWVPTWRSQVDLDTPWIPKPTWAAIRQSLVYLGFGADWTGDAWSILRLSLVSGGLLATLAYAAWKGLARSPAARRVFFPAVYLLGPGLLLVGVSLQRSVYQDKQLLIVLPALLMVAGWGMCQGGRRLAAASLLLVVALTLVPLYESYFVKVKPQWREMSQHIAANWQAGDVIYYNAGSASVSTAFYLDDSFPQVGFPMLWQVEKGPREGQPATAEEIDKQLGELAQNHKRVWLVNYYPAYWDPSGFIQAWIKAHADSQPTPAFYGMKLELYVLK